MSNLIGSELPLVERLRKMKGIGDYQLAALMDGVGPQAADEIEKLRTQLHEYGDGMRMAREHLSAAFKVRMGAESVLEHIQRAFRVWPKPANE